MLLTSSVSGLFKWRQFEPEVILLAVGWYLRFSLSYRDVEELLAERGLHADHVTVWGWVQRYAPEMERRLRSRLDSTTTVGEWTKPTSGSRGSELIPALPSPSAAIGIVSCVGAFAALCLPLLLLPFHRCERRHCAVSTMISSIPQHAFYILLFGVR